MKIVSQKKKLQVVAFRCASLGMLEKRLLSRPGIRFATKLQAVVISVLLYSANALRFLHIAGSCPRDCCLSECSTSNKSPLEPLEHHSSMVRNRYVNQYPNHAERHKLPKLQTCIFFQSGLKQVLKQWQQNPWIFLTGICLIIFRRVFHFSYLFLFHFYLVAAQKDIGF